MDLVFSYVIYVVKTEIEGDIMDFMMGKITDLINKYAKNINVPHIPLEKFNEYMNLITPHLATANSIFPVDDLLLMCAILIGLTAVLFILFVIKFIRGMLPF